MAKKDVEQQQKAEEQKDEKQSLHQEPAPNDKMKKILERQLAQKDEGQLGPDPDQPPARLAPNIQPGQPLPSDPDPKQYPSEKPKQEFGARLKRSGLLPREPSE